MVEVHAAEKRKMLKDFEAKKRRMLREHNAEVEEKEKQIFEARQAAQDAERTLRSAEGHHTKVQRSLELTGARVLEREARQESWTKFLRLLDGELSRKSSFPSTALLFPVLRRTLMLFPRRCRRFPCLE